MEQDRTEKGQAQVEGWVPVVEDRRAVHARDWVRGAAKEWGAVGAKAEDRRPAQTRVAVWAAVDAGMDEQQTPQKRQEINMPSGDRTGPMGMGPMTSRAAGFCAGNRAPGYMHTGGGRGFEMGSGCGFGGRGGGRGWRNMFYATGLPGWARSGVPVTPAPAQELAVLKEQAEYLGTALENIHKRVQEIETQPAGK